MRVKYEVQAVLHICIVCGRVNRVAIAVGRGVINPKDCTVPRPPCPLCGCEHGLS